MELHTEERDLDVEQIRLMEMGVKSYDTDYLSIDNVVNSWKETLYGPLYFYRSIQRPLKSEDQYIKEGLYHLAAVSYLKAGRNDLARKLFEKAIEKFDKKGHKEALEGDFRSFRNLLEKACCQILAASTEIGPDMTKADQDSYGWRKLRKASTTLQIIFEINHQKKTGISSKELVAAIVEIYHGLRTRLTD